MNSLLNTVNKMNSYMPRQTEKIAAAKQTLKIIDGAGYASHFGVRVVAVCDSGSGAR